MNERKPRAETRNGFANVFATPPQQSNPLVALEQMKREISGELARMEQESKLEIMKMNGMVMALKEAMPIIDRVAGNSTQSLSTLSDLILQRGCDVAERCVEITLNPDV